MRPVDKHGRVVVKCRNENGKRSAGTVTRIYLDNAATTAVSQAVMDKMLPYYMTVYGNPSSIHAAGREGKKAVEHARRQVANALHAKAPQEIYFTAGGSESDNWAIKGVAFAHQDKGRHIITTQVEHHAVLHTCQWLEKQGWQVTYLPVDAQGFVTPEQVAQAIRPDTVLVSVMAANNEIGTIEPIAEIGRLCHERGVLFHTDAVQAVGALPLDVQAMQVDLLSLSAHKFHGPKGVGALYIRQGVKMDALVHGGAQERSLRAGTENLPGIVGLGEAITIATAQLEENTQRMRTLRDRLVTGLRNAIPDMRLNGPEQERLPNNANVSFCGIEGEAVLLRLDLEGIAASSGSACTAGSLDPSHVLMAIGLTMEEAKGSLRLTLGSDTTEDEIDVVVEKLPVIVRSLRDMTGYVCKK